MIIAVIDIGTNSTRLLIAEYKGQDIVTLYNDLEITRIGEGIGKLPYIRPEALKRTLACLGRFIKKCEEYKADKVRITATSAVRDAENKNLVKEAIFQKTGKQLEILTGEEEARLSYLGAISDFSSSDQEKVVLDIGGGSTELVYPLNGELQFRSVNLGAVRLAEEPSLMEETNNILDGLFSGNRLDKSHLIGVGGTVTTLVAIKLELENYNPELVHGYKLSLEETKKLEKNLFSLSTEERKKLKGLQPQRADIIPYGVYILNRVMDKFGCQEIIVSEKDILYGLIITALNGECYD